MRDIGLRRFDLSLRSGAGRNLIQSTVWAHTPLLGNSSQTSCVCAPLAVPRQPFRWRPQGPRRPLKRKRFLGLLLATLQAGHYSKPFSVPLFSSGPRSSLLTAPFLVWGTSQRVVDHKRIWGLRVIHPFVYLSYDTAAKFDGYNKPRSVTSTPQQTHPW